MAANNDQDGSEDEAPQPDEFEIEDDQEVTGNSNEVEANAEEDQSAPADRSNADTARYVDGWSNLTLGVKHHVGGASDGGPSSAWFAEVELPTGASPYRGQGARPSARWVTEWDLPDDFSLGLMPGVKYDTSDAGRFVSGSFGATLGKDFGEATQVFVELASPQITTPRYGGTQLSFDSGVQYKIGKNFQLDAAVFLGLNDHTPDATFTVGASSRW